MKLYKSCKTLSIARFFRIIETEDLRNLIVDFDYENDKIKINETTKNELQQVFDDIYFEYSELSENHKLLATLKKQLLIAEWTFMYNIITHSINLYINHKDDSSLEFINSLDQKEYKIDFKEPIPKQIQDLKTKMKGLKNKIKIFKIKLSQSLKTEKKEVKIDLDEDALYLEHNLDLKREINPETTSVSKWLKLIKMNKEKSKAQDK